MDEKTLDCIAAVSTPLSTGGVSMIRISGADALTAAKKVFRPHYPVTDIEKLGGYCAAYGDITDGDRKIDDGVLLVFRAPHSYTGENVAEITCHGGIFVTEKVLRLCLDAGAKQAAAGEFTKRALLNGKMSLTEAEAVMDLISSESEQMLTLSRAQADGALYGRINRLCDEILDISSEIAAWIDYPDEAEDEDAINRESWQKRIAALKEKTDDLLSTYDDGKIIRNGIETAIVGKPNAGKSTLMNLLSGTEKSIVTDIEGTTRDIVEQTVRLKDITLNLADCAGIRKTDDTVESIGVEKMIKRLGQSQLILAVFDGARALSDEDMQLIELIKGRTVLPLINKSDLDIAADISVIEDRLGTPIVISAKSGDGKDRLYEAIVSVCKIKKLDAAAGFLANERQRACAASAKEHIGMSLAALSDGMTADVAGLELEAALAALYELSGKQASEEVIDSIFKRFCVGK